METYAKGEDGTLEVIPAPIQPEPTRYTLDELRSMLEASLVRLANHNAGKAMLEEEVMRNQTLVDKAIELNV